MPTARQRGFYSEILDSEMEGEKADQLLQSASCGPRALDLQPRFCAPKYAVPKAAVIAGGGDEAMQAAIEKQKRLAATHTSSAPSRALEPKVLVPFQPGPGKTPRRIVIERQKRLFALQDLAQVRAEGIYA